MRYSLFRTFATNQVKPTSTYSPAVSRLLSLVRASLWQVPADTAPFTGAPADWNDIGALARLQTVAPLAVEGAMTLPPHLQPPKEWLLKGLSLVERNKRTHLLLDSCVAETFTRLAEAGITPVLLKGQAYARAYPKPTLRQCGDIDIYVGEDSYRRAYEASRRYGWESPYEFSPKEKHYVCYLNDVKIEMHRHAVQLASRKIDRLFNQWSTGQLYAGGRSITIGGEPVAVPTPMFDVVFSFTHLFHHFLQGGIGLRQICDWAMLLHTHAAGIDRQELEKLLKDFGLLRAWRIFTPIAVDHLGLPQDQCPLYSPKYRRKAGMALSFIMREGNFGQGRRPVMKRPQGYIMGKAYSFIISTSRLYSKLCFDPVTIIAFHAGLIRNGIRRVLDDMKD